MANGRTVFSNLKASQGTLKILTFHHHHHHQFLELTKVNFFVNIMNTNDKISSLTLWVSCALHRYNSIIVIIVFLVVVRWKIQLVGIPTTAQKIKLSVFKRNFAIARLIANCNTFSIVNESMYFHCLMYSGY